MSSPSFTPDDSFQIVFLGLLRLLIRIILMCTPDVSEGLEDNTTGSVAETVASVLRGCLESMPKGEPA